MPEKYLDKVIPSDLALKDCDDILYENEYHCPQAKNLPEDQQSAIHYL